jgi:hypothetical protein
VDPSLEVAGTPKEQSFEGGRSAGSLGVKFDKVKAQLPSLSAKTKVFVLLRAPDPKPGSAGILEKLERQQLRPPGHWCVKSP